MKLRYLILLLPFPVLADCLIVEDLAKKIMQARQLNMSISKVMKIMKHSNPKVDVLMSSMVLEAYKKPRLSTEKNQEIAVQEFANRWGQMCYEIKNNESLNK